MNIPITYLAGFFDGEGCIDVQRVKDPTGKGRIYVRPRVRLGMADSARFVLEALHAQYGGYLSRRSPANDRQQASTSWELLSAADIVRMLTAMEPHLIIKRQQALLALWWVDNLRGKQKIGVDLTPARLLLAEELTLMKRDAARACSDAIARIALAMKPPDTHAIAA